MNTDVTYITCNASWSTIFSVEVTVYDYHEYYNVWDVPIGELLCTYYLSCKKEVGNIYEALAN